MSPREDENATSIAWDVWSLGILTAQLVTNNHPFAAQTLKALMKKVLFNDPEIPQNLASPFKEIIEGCLIKDRANRWTAKQVLNALESNIIVLITAKANYTRLNQLLADKNWKDADQETANIMLKIMHRESQGWLDDDDCKNFPPDELKIIDQLWVKHSNGHFGFSVQKEIFTSAKVGGKVGEYDYSTWCKFGEEVGWRKGGSWVSYSELSFDIRSNKGHLPYGVVGFVVFWGVVSSRATEFGPSAAAAAARLVGRAGYLFSSLMYRL